MCDQFPKLLPSEVWGIADETVAVAFNLAASFRLFAFKNELENDRLKALADSAALSSMGIGGQVPYEDEVWADGQFLGYRKDSLAGARMGDI